MIDRNLSIRGNLERIKSMISKGEVQQAESLLKILEENTRYTDDTKDVEILAITLKMRILIVQGKFEDAIDFAEKKLREKFILDDYFLSLEIILLLIESLNKKGNFKKSLQVIEKSEQQLNDFPVSVQNEQKNKFATLFLLKGVVYQRLGNFQKAENYLLRTLDIEKSSGNYKGLSAVFNNLGTLF